MKIRILVLCVCLASCEIGRKQSREKAISQSRAAITALMESKKIPGLAITVMQQGEILWTEGFGHADLEHDVHVDPSRTKFRIGSISKSLTAAGLAKLYEEQRIFLDSSIYFYFPDYSKYQYRPTVRQLAGHIAGVRHYKGNEFLNTQHFAKVTDGLAMFKDDPLLFIPGERYEYTSHGFNLLSAIIERAAQQDFLAYMKQSVFIPLSLNQTCADMNDSIIYDRTKFYEVKDGKLINAPYVNNSYKWAGGGFISSAEDVAKFGNALLENKFLKPETLQLFTTPQKLNDGTSTTYGIGFACKEDFKGKPYFGHSGGSVGGTSNMVIYPDEKIVVVVLTNLSSAGLGDIAQEIGHYIMQE